MTPLTPAELARLDALRPEILSRLAGDGVTLAWIGERAGIAGARKIGAYLHALGVPRSCGARWRLPSTARHRLSLHPE